MATRATRFRRLAKKEKSDDAIGEQRCAATAKPSK